MKTSSTKAILAILTSISLILTMCVTAALASDDVAAPTGTADTTVTTTAVACYATVLDYDMSAMTVGETRAIRFYHPNTKTAAGASIDEVSSNISYSYDEGSDTVYVTALAAGNAKLYIREANCAFGAYVNLTVVDNIDHDVTNDGTTNIMDVVMIYQYASGKIMLPMEVSITGPFYKHGDVNQDGIVNTTDVLALYQLISGTV